MSRGGHEA
eukprot:gene4856-biopygen1616